MIRDISCCEALQALTSHMKDDPQYAWSWHCNLAMMAYDAGANGINANEQAASFMQTVFGVGTFSRWKRVYARNMELLRRKMAEADEMIEEKEKGKP